MQLTMRLSGVPWEPMNAILDTGAGPNVLCEDAIPQFYVNKLRTMKPKRLQSAAEADITLQVAGSIMLFIQLW